MSFWILGSQESNASNGTWFGFEMNKLWPLEDRLCKGAKISHLEIQKCEKSFPRCEIFFKVRKCSKLQEWAAKFPILLPNDFPKPQNGYKMISKLQNGLLKCFYFSMGCKNVFSFPFDCKTWPPSYDMASKLWNGLQATKMICKNTLQSQGKLKKCQQSLTTMHLKKRVLSLRSHMKSLIPFLTS